MGAPSQQQIDEVIADGLARGVDEGEVLAHLAGLERMSDGELAAVGVTVRPPPAQPAPTPATDPAPTFAPVPVRARHDGWTVDRQRTFIAALAETGCVSEACGEVGITARSAYRLRAHPGAAAFRDAWDHAQSLASARLTALAWERAVHGTPERMFKDGELVAERRRPSDRLLMWLLAHHHPTAYGWAAKPPATAPDSSFFPVEHARAQLPAALRRLRAVDDSDCPLEFAPLNDLDFDDCDHARA